MADDIVTGLGTAIEADGITVGGVQSFRFATGQARDVVHRPLGSTTPYVLPGQVDFDTVSMQAYRQPDDPGQQRLFHAFRDREMLDCVISFPGGLEWSFKAFVRSFPQEASLRGVQQTPIVLRINGGLSTT